MICEDVVKGRAREAQGRSREVQQPAYRVAGEWSLVENGEAICADDKPDCSKNMRPDVGGLVVHARDGEYGRSIPRNHFVRDLSPRPSNLVIFTLSTFDSLTP